MKIMLKTAFLAVICILCITGCSSLPDTALYTEPIAKDVSVNTINDQFDVSYTIDCCVMPYKKKDFLSVNIDTMLYTYRLNFSIQRGMKAILDRFFSISEMADMQSKKNGIRYLGETTLYAYALFENSITRLVVNSKIQNHVRFSFLLKDGEKYLLLERFQVTTLDGPLTIDDTVDSIPFKYEDIKKVYDFFNNEESLESVRQKQLHIAAAMKQADMNADQATTSLHISDETSPAENTVTSAANDRVMPTEAAASSIEADPVGDAHQPLDKKPL